MPANEQHHTTRKRRFTVMFVPNEDGGSTKRFRITPWQGYGLILAAFVVVVAGVVSLLYYTPIGALIPIPNPVLEKRYATELVSLNERVTGMMEQIIELKAYNVKLRNALGEEVLLTDSGTIVVNEPRRATPTGVRRDEPRALRDRNASPAVPDLGIAALGTESLSESDQLRTSFPAVLPTDGYVTRGFDVEEGHFGLDIAGKTGSPVSAAAEGFVVFAGWTHEDGYVMILSHSAGFLTIYKHNQGLLRSPNTYVRRGEPIALLGSSGETSSGPHLHFEIWKDGTPVNPSSYLLTINM